MKIEDIMANEQVLFDPPQAPTSEPMSFKETIFPTTSGSTNSDMLYYLKLQIEIMRESREYQALSNVLKAKHDTATNAIRNIR